MPRERQFSEADVLDAAADAFTRHGYSGTSVSMLLEATGLAKQSLYNCFGDKRTLYLRAVDNATARWEPVALQMARAADGRAALAQFFDTLLGRCLSDDPAQRNCIVSAGLLEGIDDAGIQGQLRGKWAATHEMLRAQVERGQKDGSIANPAPSAELADHLMAAMSGLRVAAQGGIGRERLARIAATALAVLERPG
jgi:TetR/AcrR family transcriptional regulator, transcriptional repressor for nem operon